MTDREQFLSDVLVTAVEGGINYWAYVEEYDPNTSVHLVDTLDDEAECLYFVRLPDIASAIINICNGFKDISEDRKEIVIKANASNEAGDIDADIADAIVQIAVFGEITYG